MKQYYLILLCTLIGAAGFAQTFDLGVIRNAPLEEFIRRNQAFNGDWRALVDSVRHFNAYPGIDRKGKEYIYYFNDTVTSLRVPVRIYIPTNYDRLRRNRVAVYFRGAEKLSTWDQVDTLAHRYIPRDSFEYSGGPIVDYLIERDDRVVVRPIPDGERGFCFAVNCDRPGTVSRGASIAARLITNLKRFLNLDDDHMSVWGHSDGADAAFLLGSLSPSAVKSVSLYNSMLTQIFGQTYLGNLANRPVYVVHSNMDNLRKIGVTRQQIALLDSIGHPHYVYKEYGGYTHDDTHLGIDVPAAVDYVEALRRNPYPNTLSWEADTLLYGTVDWLTIDSLETTTGRADWHRDLQLINQFVWKGQTVREPYYGYPKPSGKVVATYVDNAFDIKTSGVQTFTLRLFPQGIDYDRPIRVVVNGKTVYEERVEINPQYILESFRKNGDRSQIWTGEITIGYKN